MLRPENDEGRPGANRAASNVTVAGDEIQCSCRADRKPAALADLDAMAENLRGRFVIQVNIEGDRWRTHVYRSAAAAEKAVDRAAARGQRAHVTLCQMLPVGVVVGLGVTR